uniref:Uncharacterized protein n=1 Tax=Tanacetum cinerariifolium TaxID=118510 RepID=A0A6L2LKE2_TANCI|nr:hypothetical protein [Tanacetum cinerariifolium]
MANNNFHTVPLANLDEDSKKRKREENLRTWKWNEIIDVDALPDKVEIKNDETRPQVVASDEDSTYQEENLHEASSDNKENLYEDSNAIVIADVDVPKEVRERNNNVELKEEHVTVDVPNQYDVQSDDDVPVASIKRNETENQNPWPFDDEVVDEDEGEDEVAEEDEVDDEDEWT